MASQVISALKHYQQMTETNPEFLAAWASGTPGYEQMTGCAVELSPILPILWESRGEPELAERWARENVQGYYALDRYGYIKRSAALSWIESHILPRPERQAWLRPLLATEELSAVGKFNGNVWLVRYIRCRELFPQVWEATARMVARDKEIDMAANIWWSVHIDLVRASGVREKKLRQFAAFLEDRYLPSWIGREEVSMKMKTEELVRAIRELNDYYSQYGDFALQERATKMAIAGVEKVSLLLVMDRGIVPVARARL